MRNFIKRGEGAAAMKHYYLLPFLLIACDADVPVAYRPLCDVETAERRAAFIIDCARAANPLSDEEGEDLVHQCQKTAEGLMCPSSPYVYLGDYHWEPCAMVKNDPRCIAALREAK
jgi:hypothetical protein